MNLQRLLVLCALAASGFLSPCLRAADDYNHYTSVGQIGMTVTNFGLIGHGYNIEGQPSCLYKQYSELDFEQVEHFSYGGIWVGGIVEGVHRVSTGCVDGSPSSRPGWEWNNAGQEEIATNPAYSIIERSGLRSSSHYDTTAISHQDFYTSYTDTATVVPGETTEILNHTPMGLKVDLTSLAWNYSYAEGFVILDATITNISQQYDPDSVGWTIDSVRVGYWLDESVGNFNYTDYYTPGEWDWRDNLAGIVRTDGNTTAEGDTINMGIGYDADGDLGYAESMVGCRFIGGSAPHLSDPTALVPNSRVWVWTSTYNSDFPDLIMPANDEERFFAMATTPSLDDAAFPYGEVDAQSWMVLTAADNFGRLEPGESLNAVFAIGCAEWEFISPSDVPNTGEEYLQMLAHNLVVSTNWARIAWDGEDKNRNGVLDPGEDQDGDDILDRYLLPMPPPSPKLHVEVGNHEATLYWTRAPEDFVDPILGWADFEGYRIYSSNITEAEGDDNTLLAQFDLENDIWPNLGLEEIKVRHVLGIDADSVLVDGVYYHYAFHLTNLPNGRPNGNWLAVSAYDQGMPENELPSLESNVRENWVFIYPGNLPDTAVDGQDPKPGVYPNPYRGNANWDGSGPYDRVIWFTHLPARCTISIFTLAGDLVDVLEHDAATYQGQDVLQIREAYDTANTDSQSADFVFSGGEHAWDLVTRDDQAIATGLYLFAVEDKATGEVEIGKFAVIK